MEKLIAALQDRKKTVPKLAKNSTLFKTIIQTIQDKKGEKIVVLDLRKIDEAVADFFILCDGNSHVQVKAIADNIKDKVEEVCNDRPYHIEYGEKWTLVDYVNVVVHVFQEDHRAFYSLETLWADAEMTEY